MKRISVLAVLLGVVGIGGMAQFCCPPTTEPPCFTAFWQGDVICFELVLPWWGWWGCCPAPPIQVTGWRVVTLDGTVVYLETFPAPAAPGRYVWKQVDTVGNPVPPGYYKIVVVTTVREYESTVRIVARPSGTCCFCCFPFFFFGCVGLWSRPCPVPWCQPYVRVYQCPCC